MPTTKQDKAFTESVLGNLLDDTVSWIQDNLKPDDVFSDKQLDAWAMDNDYILQGAIDYEKWAEENGYVKE